MGEHRLELLQPDAATVHSATSRALLKTREFENGGIDKMLAETITKPAQTKWAVPIVLVHKVDGTL